MIDDQARLAKEMDSKPRELGFLGIVTSSPGPTCTRAFLQQGSPEAWLMFPWGGAQVFVPWAQIILITCPITDCLAKDRSPREGILALATASPVPLNPGQAITVLQS